MAIFKNIFALIIIIAILFFVAVGVAGTFVNATPIQMIISFAGAFALLAAFIIPAAYYQKKTWGKRKKANDEYGREVWLQAEAERNASNKF